SGRNIMSKAIVCDLKEEAVKIQQEPSDRLVYSNYFVPVQLTFPANDIQILPFYKKNFVLEAVKYGVIDPGGLARAPGGPAIVEVLRQNAFDPTTATTLPNRTRVALNNGETVANSDNDSALRGLGDAQELLTLVGTHLNQSDRSIFAVATKKIDETRT